MNRVLRERTALLPTLLVGAIVVLAYPLLTVTDAAADPSPESDDPEQVADEPPGERPIIFAHRGTSGYRPEHTVEAYEFAIQMDVDSVEPDLVSTKDGHLVARHENWIGGTTDVAERPEFADRQTTKTVSGTEVEDEWFTEDFTLEELKTLRGVEPVPDLRQHNTIYDGRFEIATLQEVIDLVEEANRERPEHEQIGIFPETKHPTYFESIGLGLEEPLAELVEENDLNRPDSGVMLQSFEPTSLQKLDELLDVPKAQAITTSGAPYDTIARGEGPTFEDMITPDGLEEIATYAEWIGPHKNLVIPREDDDSLGEPSPLVNDAHDAGLEVAAYTFRNENNYLPTDLQIGDDPSHYGDAIGEYVAYFEAGVDGVWSDNPDTAMIARDEFKGPSNLVVEPSFTEVEVGDATQLTGTVVYEDGSEQDVTDEAQWSADDQEVATVDAGLVTGVAEGEATVTIAFDGLSASSTVTVIEDEADAEALERISAEPGRVEVAIAASQHRFGDGEAGAVVLARADEYPDALAGTTLAAEVDAPLLLTSSDELLDNVADEVVRVLGDEGAVYLTGGTAALDETVEDAVEGLGYELTRLGGDTRFETAGLIAEALGERSQVLVTTGLDFPDALTAGAAAAANDGVVLLSADEDPHDVVDDYLDGFAGGVTAVGGPAARAYPDAAPVMGATRDETAVAVAEAFFHEPVAFGIARRDDYPDALSGGAHIAAFEGPLLLTYTEDVPDETAGWLSESEATGGFVYGGTAAVDEDTFDQIEDLIFNNDDEES